MIYKGNEERKLGEHLYIGGVKNLSLKQKAFKLNSMCDAVSVHDNTLVSKKKVYTPPGSSGLQGDQKVVFIEFFNDIYNLDADKTF